MFTSIDYVMVTVSEMARSVQFYRDILGLPLRFESPFWSEFETGRTTLALHGGGEAPPAAPQRGVAGTATLGFETADLDAAHQLLQSRGVRFLMPPTERVEERIRLAVFLDPDGLPISLAQRGS